MSRNRILSFVVKRPIPSAILDGIEMAALRI